MPAEGPLVVVGTGLLGTSLALALKRAGRDAPIVGVGRSGATLQAAEATGGYDRTTTGLGDAVADAAMVVLATPLSAFDGLLEAIADACGSRHDDAPLIVTDVGSTKVGPRDAARRRLPATARFVGSHPMAGSEHSGPEAADAGLFAGRPCVVCREPDTDPEALGHVKRLWEKIGMRALTMTAEEHDRRTAAVSHLPHAAAVMLVHTAEALGGWDVASTGFRDTSRLASSNPPMRRDIMVENAPALRDALAELRRQIDTLDATLTGGDAAALLDFLDTARARRDAWVKDLEP